MCMFLRACYFRQQLDLWFTVQKSSVKAAMKKKLMLPNPCQTADVMETQKIYYGQIKANTANGIDKKASSVWEMADYQKKCWQ